MAGTQPFQIRSEFDPREITLGDLITLYEKESTEIGGRKNQRWGNLLRKNKALQPYLDQPAITIFGPVETDSQSFMTDIEKAAGKGSAGRIQSNIRVLENNIFPKLDALSKRTGEDLKGNLNLSPISTEVVKLQTRGKAATIDKQFNVGKIGELIENLQKHVADNPADKPIANAIIFGLEMGSRPSLGTELTTAHYIKDQFDESGRLLGLGGRDGVVIPAGTVGIKRQGKEQAPNVKPYNAPLSSRALVILQDQSEYNSKIIGNDKISHYFQLRRNDGKVTPVTLDDMNRVLKVTSPFGIRQKILTPKEIAEGPPGTKSVKPMANPITASMLRNLYINLAVQSIRGPNAEQRVAMLLNRDVATNVGAQEVYMGTPGQYKQAAVKDLDQISSKSWGLFSLRTPEAVNYFTQESKIRNPREFIFGTNAIDANTNKFIPDEVQYMAHADEGFAQFEPKNIGIQNTGINFAALTLDEEEVDQVFKKEKDGKQTGYSDRLKEKIAKAKGAIIDNKNLMIGLGTTAVGVVGDVASKILGATEMPRTVEKIEEMGGSKLLQGAGALSEVAGPFGFSDVTSVVDPVAKTVVESATKAEDETNEQASSLISKALTGGLPLPQLNFNEGGFINKKERADAGQ